MPRIVKIAHVYFIVLFYSIEENMKIQKIYFYDVISNELTNSDNRLIFIQGITLSILRVLLSIGALVEQ